MSETELAFVVMVVVGFWEWGCLTLALWLEDDNGNPLATGLLGVALLWAAWPVVAGYVLWRGTLERGPYGPRIVLPIRWSRPLDDLEATSTGDVASEPPVGGGALRVQERPS